MKRYFNDVKYGLGVIWKASGGLFILKMALMLVSAAIPYLPIFLWRRVINDLADFIKGQNEDIIAGVLVFAGLYAAVLFAESALGTFTGFVDYRYYDAIEYYMDNQMIDKITGVDLAFFDSSLLKDRVQNSWQLTSSIQRVVWTVFGMIESAVRLFVSLALIAALGIWLIPLIVVLSIPAVIGDKKVSYGEYKLQKDVANPERRMNYIKQLFFTDTIYEMKLYSLKEQLIGRYAAVWKDVDRKRTGMEKKSAATGALSALLLAVGDGAVYAVAIRRLLAGLIGVGDVSYYISLVSRFRSDFTSFFYQVNNFGRSSKELEDVREFLELSPLLEKSGKLIPADHPRIEFENVSFAYPNAAEKVLENCSFVLEPGISVGLVGLNGSGKSTIVKLLLRFYDPTEGRILINGADARDYDINALRALYGVLFQETIKYSVSVREYIGFADIPRMDDDDALDGACEKSSIKEMVHGWEKKYDEGLTRWFDKKGREPSGGQWQRLALARAFFRPAPAMLLDEPSAALDPLAEHEIFEKISELSDGKSALMISHRLSSIVLADIIMVLDGGRIIEQGSHAELMEMGGKYAGLFTLQAEKYM